MVEHPEELGSGRMAVRTVQGELGANRHVKKCGSHPRSHSRERVGHGVSRVSADLPVAGRSWQAYRDAHLSKRTARAESAAAPVRNLRAKPGLVPLLAEARGTPGARKDRPVRSLAPSSPSGEAITWRRVPGRSEAERAG